MLRASRTVTNPAEVAKTRLQLDGELAGGKGVIAPVKPVGSGAAAAAPVVPAALQKGSSGKVYSGPIDCLKKTYQFEGIRGLQRGLGAAVSLGRRADDPLQLTPRSGSSTPTKSL